MNTYDFDVVTGGVAPRTINLNDALKSVAWVYPGTRDDGHEFIVRIAEPTVHGGTVLDALVRGIGDLFEHPGPQIEVEQVY